MMKVQDLLKSIDAQSQEYVSFLKDICTFEATAWEKEELDKMVDFIEAFARDKGFTITRTPFEKCGDFLTVDLNEGAEKSHMFLAHIDTVHKKGVFGEPAVTIYGDMLKGPGATDCKGGIAVALLAMKALKDCGFTKHTRLILTSDEEISNILGGEKEIQFFKDSATGFKSALNCEGTGGDRVVVARKGIWRLEMDIQGKSGHSGGAYFESASAIREAAYKIVELEKHSERGGNTYNCSIIQGGSVGNIIPDSCKFTVDIRTVGTEGMEQAKQLVEQVAEKSFVEGTKTTVRTISSRPPMLKNEDTMQLFEDLRAVSKKYDLGDLEAISAGGGSDSVYTQMAGVPSICQMGSIGSKIHTDQEFTYISSIARRAKLLAAFCAEN